MVDQAEICHMNRPHMTRPFVELIDLIKAHLVSTITIEKPGLITPYLSSSASVSINKLVKSDFQKSFGMAKQNSSFIPVKVKS